MGLTQSNMQRFGALLAWLAVEFIAYHITEMAPRTAWYYPIAGVFNVMVISIFLSFRPTQLIADLVKLTGMQLVTQAVGWALYALHFHNTSAVYNPANIATEIATLLRFFIVRKDDGVIAIHFYRDLFHMGAFMGRSKNKRARQ